MAYVFCFFSCFLLLLPPNYLTSHHQLLYVLWHVCVCVCVIGEKTFEHVVDIFIHRLCGMGYVSEFCSSLGRRFRVTQAQASLVWWVQGNLPKQLGTGMCTYFIYGYRGLP